MEAGEGAHHREGGGQAGDELLHSRYTVYTREGGGQAGDELLQAEHKSTKYIEREYCFDVFLEDLN